MPNNSIASWYNSQYRVWDRRVVTRRLQMAPFLAQAERNVPSAAPAPPTDAVAIDMSNVRPADKESHSESLFGPPIPADAAALDAHSHSTQPHDQISQSVVDHWVEKNKQGHEPATTLQALVNLKRPSLRLTPLTSNASNTDLVTTNKASHGLEFEYDCDAAKCHIIVSMSPNAPNSTSKLGDEKPEDDVVVFDGIVDGGFGRTLKHEHGAILDLAHHDVKEADTYAVEDSPAPELPAAPEPVAQPHSRRRISIPFHIRRRSRVPQQVAGPSLPVVDAEAQVPVVEGSSKDHEPKEASGTHVSIKLEALDEGGKPYTNRNAQTTFLHVVKLGQPPADGAEDTRSWVVRVLKREATIGTHTFRLHEIYGLASANAPSHAPAPSYPPAAPTTDADGEVLPDAHAQQQTYDFAGAECVLCLSSPREVVLLPCRHLVACKECADNMITFGAGEGVSAPAAETNAEPTATNGTNGSNGAGAASTPNTSGPEPLTPFQAAAQAGRRKRKAKGWFCPVCRQPYTSMLRISMQPLNMKPDDTTPDATSPTTNELEAQMQSKGPLSGMVSIARDMLGRKPATESSVHGEADTETAGQPATNNATSASNNA
ncbi:Zinc finger, C3HC4 type (RING finger) protein [Ceratobasidium sp. AG-Ba]|nr:Zinc finger, C3HC4 type (RING finger) protein [Ceratobasidium sp. AG-Ba]